MGGYTHLRGCTCEACQYSRRAAGHPRRCNCVDCLEDARKAVEERVKEAEKFMADGLKLAAEAERGARAKSPSTYVQLCAKLGPLLDTKAVAYGDSAANAGRMLELLYPKGVATHQYRDALLVVRILDKLSRIAQRGADGKDKGGESPWQDIAGYGVIGWKLDEAP